MNKVCVVGCGGSGKSTFAQQLGEITGLPVYHLDVYFWKPGWVQRETEEWCSIVSDLVKKDKWIMDGNFNGTQDIRFAEADTILFLDLPMHKCLINAFKRLVIYRYKKRADMAYGCNEKLDFSYYKWIWSYKKNHGKKTMERLERLQGEKEIVILKSHQEADEYSLNLKSHIVNLKSQQVLQQ